MKDSQPASIVNISSIAGLIASDTMPGYNASKAAVWMLTKSVALYCSKMGWDIRCNSVHPTFVDTPILDGIGKNAGIDKDVVMGKLARQIPLGRVGKPQEIAEKIAEGKMRKFFEEVTLLGQKYVRDDSMQVRDILPEGVTVTSFHRMRVGEGGE